MTNLIHMETEQVRDTARRLQMEAGEVSARREALRAAAARLEAAWQGGPAVEFQQELDGLVRTLDLQAEALDRLGLRLMGEVNEWERVDRAFGSPSGQDFSLAGAWRTIRSTGSAGVETARSAARSVGEFLGLIPTERSIFLKQWQGMDQDQRLEYLQQQHEAMAKQYHFPPTKIATVDLADPAGYDLRGQRRPDQIIIDLDNLQRDRPWDIQETIAHESRHEMQQYLVAHPDARPAAVPKAQIEAWQANFADYHASSDDFQAYWEQPVEADARSFADEYLEGLYP